MRRGSRFLAGPAQRGVPTIVARTRTLFSAACETTSSTAVQLYARSAGLAGETGRRLATFAQLIVMRTMPTRMLLSWRKAHVVRP